MIPRLQQLSAEHIPTLPTIRLGRRLILLTMVRKSELQFAVGASQPIEKVPESGRLKRPQPVKVGQPGRANKAVQCPPDGYGRIVDARFAMQ